MYIIKLFTTDYKAIWCIGLCASQLDYLITNDASLILTLCILFWWLKGNTTSPYGLTQTDFSPSPSTSEQMKNLLGQSELSQSVLV
jgi:hypothetical protein